MLYGYSSPPGFCPRRTPTCIDGWMGDGSGRAGQVKKKVFKKNNSKTTLRCFFLFVSHPFREVFKTLSVCEKLENTNDFFSKISHIFFFYSDFFNFLGL